MKLRTRVCLIYMIPGVILTILAGLAFYLFASISLQTEVFNTLSTAAHSRAAQVSIYLDMLKGRMVDFSSDQTVQECAASLNGTGAGTCSEAILTQYLRENRLPIIDSLEDLFIIDASGVVVVATNSAEVGTSLINDPAYVSGMKRPHVDSMLHPSADGSHIIFHVAAPILVDGAAIGVIVGEMNARPLYDIVQNIEGLGETGEMYLVGEHNLMLSPSRFKEGAALTQSINSPNLRECFSDYQQYAGEEGTIEEHVETINKFVNYRNVAVIGAHGYVPATGWCLLAESEQSEANAPIRELLGFLSVVAGVVVVIVFGLSLWLGSQIAGPILKLRRDVDIVRQGHLDYRVDTKTDDELGDLSRSFDEMTYSFRKFTETAKVIEKNKTDNLSDQSSRKNN